MSDIAEIIGERDPSMLSGHSQSLRRLKLVVYRAIGEAATRSLESEEVRDLIDDIASLEASAEILDRIADEIDQ